jgi:anti-anti-sigma regulatory factor
MEYFISKKDFLAVVSLKGNFTSSSIANLSKCAEEASDSRAVIITLDSNLYDMDPNGLRVAAQFFRAFRIRQTFLRFVGASSLMRKFLVDNGLAETMEFAESLPQAVSSLRELVAMRRAF